MSGHDVAAGELRRLANSVVWPGFEGNSPDSLPGWLRGALAEGLAGVVYFPQNITDEAGTRELSDEIHRLNPAALIGVDEEGGTVTRIDARGGSPTPGNAALGQVDDVEATYRHAHYLGRRLRALGVDINLAPVADVNVNPANPVIGVRSFGPDPRLVGRHVQATVRGLRDAGVAACAKHFPGHGDTTVDSHLELPVVEGTEAEVRGTHVPPFLQAIEAGVDAIMTAHLRLPAFGDLPATMNPRVLALLRDAGFDGVVVSDALDMAAVRGTYGPGPSAVMALRAGVDLICTGNPSSEGPLGDEGDDERDFHAVRDAIVSAAQDGELGLDRLREASERVARLAAATAVLRGDAGSETMGNMETEFLGIAQDAVATGGGFLPLAPGSRITVVDARPQPHYAIGRRRNNAFVDALARTCEVAVLEAPAVENGPRPDGEVLVVAIDPVLNEQERHLVDRTCSAWGPATVVVTGTGGDLAGFPHPWVRTFGISRANAHALAATLVEGMD